jgi:hypothetical protein
MVLGHPRHLVWGGATNAGYAAFGVDVIEQSLWLGFVPLALIVARRRTWGARPDARFWLAVGFVFFVLSLGPFLRVAGADTGLPLPHALLRYLPGFSNARIPGRAVVMVQLAVAVLSAFALADVSKRGWIAAALALVVLESVPSRLPAYLVPQPDAVDAELSRSASAGAVAELPVGLRDGFGEVGQLDHRSLAHQLWHGQPMVGGFVARLSHRVRRAQLESPPIAALLDLSAPAQPAPLPPDAADASAAGIAFLVVNRDTFVGERLGRDLLESAGYRLIATAGARELYATGAARR